MNPSTLFFTIFVFDFAFLAINADDQLNGTDKHEVHHFHHKSHNVHHRHHSSHHGRHHGIKARDANPACVSICDIELATVAVWFNHTKELKLIFDFIPPFVKKAILGGLNISIPLGHGPVILPNGNGSTQTNGSSTTESTPGNSQGNRGGHVNGSDSSPFDPGSLLNGTLAVDLNLLYDAAAEWPILTFFAKLLGIVLSRAYGLAELFKMFPQFANIWKIVLHGLSGGCSNPDALIGNLKDLFGFNGTFGGNLFNVSYWEHVFNPAGVIENVEHAVEGGIETFANLTHLFG